MTQEEIRSRLREPVRNGEGWLAFCPTHDDRHKRSLSVRQRDGRTLIKCFAGCSNHAVVKALGITMADLFVNGNGHAPKRIVATYDYHDERGELLYQVVRF